MPYFDGKLLNHVFWPFYPQKQLGLEIFCLCDSILKLSMKRCRISTFLKILWNLMYPICPLALPLGLLFCIFSMLCSHEIAAKKPAMIAWHFIGPLSLQISYLDPSGLWSQQDHTTVHRQRLVFHHYYSFLSFLSL